MRREGKGRKHTRDYLPLRKQQSRMLRLRLGSGSQLIRQRLIRLLLKQGVSMCCFLSGVYVVGDSSGGIRDLLINIESKIAYFEGENWKPYQNRYCCILA